MTKESCTCSARIGSIIVCYSPPSAAASANVVVAHDVTVCSSSSPLHTARTTRVEASGGKAHTTTTTTTWAGLGSAGALDSKPFLVLPRPSPFQRNGVVSQALPFLIDSRHHHRRLIQCSPSIYLLQVLVVSSFLLFLINELD